MLVAFVFGAALPAAAGAIGVYVANTASSSVSVFSIGAGGVLAPVACDPATICKTGTGPAGIAVDPSGSHLYVANSSASSVSVFAIGAGGLLAPLACDPTTICKTGNSPFGMAVDPSGSHLYVANSSASSVSVFAILAGGLLAPVACDPATICKTGSSPTGVAVDPSGSHLYVTNRNFLGSVSVFLIGAGGVLAPVTCDPTTICKTGDSPVGVAVDPSGSHLYVANGTVPGSMSVFSIGAGGVLAPVTCNPTTICKTGSNPVGVALDPSGSHLYVENSDSPSSVSVFSIGAGGVLAPVICDPATICKTGPDPNGIAVDPAGSHLYVANNNTSSVSVFSIGAGGVLAPVACDPTTICKTGSFPDFFSLAVSPDRGPTAAFSASAAPAGSTSAFDGSGSSSPDYSIVAYAWNFGDGQTQTTAGPTVQHTYAQPGSYTVALVVVDEANCSQSIVFTGQTASCNGSAKARETQTITVPQLAVGKETISPYAFPAALSGPSFQAAKKRKRRYGTKVTYTLNVAASVRFTVQQFRPGRKVKHTKKTTCDRPTKKNAKKPKCTRIVMLKGGFTRTGVAGTNTFRFTGRLNGKRLVPGKYRLVATPKANGKTGRAAMAGFKIIR